MTRPPDEAPTAVQAAQIRPARVKVPATRPHRNEISQRLGGDDPALEAGTGRTRHGSSGLEFGGDDPSATGGDAADGTTTTFAPDPTPDAAAGLRVAGGLRPVGDSPGTEPVDQTQLDAAASLNQAGHTEEPTNKPALWATAIAFGALLLVSAAWLWTRRGHYDPA